MKTVIHRREVAKILEWMDDEISGDRSYEDIVKRVRAKLDTLMQGAVLQDTIENFELPVVLDPITVIACVARHYDVTGGEILGRGQKRQLREARKVAMYLCRQLCMLPTMADIADVFGHRHHTSVIYAVNKVAQQMRQGDESIRRAVQACFKELRGDEVYGEVKDLDKRTSNVPISLGKGLRETSNTQKESKV